MKRITTVWAIVGALAGAGGLAWLATASSVPDAAMQSAPPNLSAGARASGKTTLLEFTAEWCHFCKQQAPVIAGIKESYAGSMDVRVIDVDREPELARKYGVRSVPMTVLEDANGKALFSQLGFIAQDELQRKLAEHGVVPST